MAPCLISHVWKFRREEWQLMWACWGSLKELFRSIDNHNDFIKETNLFINCNVCYLNFYISSKPWFYTFFFYHSLVVIYFMILQLQHFMPLNSLLCADVPLRNCSLTHAPCPWFAALASVWLRATEMEISSALWSHMVLEGLPSFLKEPNST